MPQQTVYDYILFRGSDIKDIRVVNSVAIPNDPAIMQMQLPPQQQNFPPTNQFSIQQGSPMAQFAPFGSMPGANIPGPTLGQVAATMKQTQQAQAQQSQSPIQQPGKTSKKNLAPGSGQKNKKSSELLSNGIDVVTSMDKSKSLATARKQSNKSQGVHQPLTHSLALNNFASIIYLSVFRMSSLLALHLSAYLCTFHHWLERQFSMPSSSSVRAF